MYRDHLDRQLTKDMDNDEDDQHQALSGVGQEPYCLSIIGVRWGVSLTTAGHTHHLYFHHYQCRNHQDNQGCQRRKISLSYSRKIFSKIEK